MERYLRDPVLHQRGGVGREEVLRPVGAGQAEHVRALRVVGRGVTASLRGGGEGGKTNSSTEASVSFIIRLLRVVG